MRVCVCVCVRVCVCAQAVVCTLSRSVMSNSLQPHGLLCQAPLSVGFFRQEYSSGLPFPSPGDLPDPGIEPGSSALQADSSPSAPPGKPPAFSSSSLVGRGLASAHWFWCLFLLGLSVCFVSATSPVR